jgi:hypothetical protein
MEKAYRNHLRAAIVAKQRGTVEVAERELGEAEKVARKAGRREWIGSVAAVRGEMRLEKRDYAEAVRQVAEVNAKGGTFHSWFIEGKAHLAQNQIERAAVAFARAESKAKVGAEKTKARDYSALCEGLVAYKAARIDRASEAFGRITDPELSRLASALVRGR